MRLILLSCLMFVLVSCGEIRLEIGPEESEQETDVSQFLDISDEPEVGTWVLGEDGLSQIASTFLLNSKTGELRWCYRQEGGGCYLVRNSETGDLESNF